MDATDLDFGDIDFDDIGFDDVAFDDISQNVPDILPSYDPGSPDLNYLDVLDAVDEQRILKEEEVEEYQYWNELKTCVSTDPIIEAVSRNKDIINMVKNLEFLDEAPLLDNASDLSNIKFDEIKDSYVYRPGDVKVDLYFLGSDLDNLSKSYPSSMQTQTRIVKDFLLSMEEIEPEFEDERFLFIYQLCSDFKDNKDIKHNNQNKFKSERLNRAREKERILGSVEYGSSLSVWNRFKKHLFREKKSNLDDVLLDPLNVDENEAFRILFSQNQRILQDVLKHLTNTFGLTLLKYFQTISSQLVHVGSLKRKRNTFRIMTGGNPNCLTILSQGDTIRNEKSLLKFCNAYIVSREYFQIVSDMRGSFGKYKSYKLSGDRVLIISNWYTITPRVLTQYSESLSKTLSFAVYTALNGPKSEYKVRVRNSFFVSMMCGLSKNREAVNFLSLSRYVSASLISKWSNIPRLIDEKLPKRMSSMFCDYIIVTYLEFLKSPEISVEWNEDAAAKEFLNQDDFTFSCRLPYMQFYTTRIQDFLSDTYLVNLCCDDLVESNKSFVEFTETLKKFEDMKTTDPDYFYCNPELIEKVSEAIMAAVVDASNFDIGAQKVEDRRLLAYCTPNGVLSEGNRRSVKLYDRILEEIYHSGREVSLKDMLRYHNLETFKFTMVEKKQKADPREIFKTDLKGIAALKIIETYIDSVNRFLFSETISMGGDQKYFRTQNETHKLIATNRERLALGESERYIYSRTSDASKWSTGDNMDSLISAFVPMSKYIEKQTYDMCHLALQNIKRREMVLEHKLYQPGQRTKGKTISQSAHLRASVNKIFSEDNNQTLTAGWPQGFFNKLSTYKHFITQTIAIIFFKLKKYERSGHVDGVIDQSCHSDDYTYIADFELESDLRLWETCLNNARRICSIKENEKKSSIGLHCREFLSFFVIMGSVFIPHCKYITGLDKDIPGTSYTDDIYATMARVRECYRIGVSEVWCQFAMQISNRRIQRMYSIAPGMSNFNGSINNYSKPCEYGGYFLSHPIFLLFFGVKANNFRLYNRYGVHDLLKIIPINYRLTEDDAEDVDDLRNLEGFFLFPKIDLKYGSDVKRIMKDLGIVKSESEFKYHERILSKYLEYDRAKELLANRLFEKSGKRMYARIPKGLMETVIHRSSSGVCFKTHFEKEFTLMQLFQFIENTKVCETVENRALVEMALFANSSVLAALQELYNSEVDVKEEIETTNRNISYMAHINLKNPGNVEVRNINECLALLCPALSETIHNKINELKPDLRKEDLPKMRSALYDTFGKESITSLEELDLMIRFFNTKYPSNKFLMVPDVRLKSGIGNIDLFLKDMLTFRVSPFIYREFDWRPIGKIKNWKDSFINSSNLLRTLQRSDVYDYLYIINNILINHFSVSKESFDKSLAYVKDVIKVMRYHDEPVLNLIKGHSSEIISSGSRASRSARMIYYLARLGCVVNEDFVNWYEAQDFPMEYTYSVNGNLHVKSGGCHVVIDRDKGATVHTDLNRGDRSVLRIFWLAQNLLRTERNESTWEPYTHSLLGKGSLFATRFANCEKDQVIVTGSGFRSGMSTSVRFDILDNVRVSDELPPKVTGYCKSSFKRYCFLSYSTINKTYFEKRKNQISMNDVESKLKILDLEMCNTSNIFCPDHIRYRDCSLSELIKHHYFDRDNILQVCSALKINVSRDYCLSVQQSGMIKQKLTKSDLESLDELYSVFAGEYGIVSDFSKNVSSRDLMVDTIDQETRVDDLVLIDFDTVEDKPGMLSQRKTSLPWLEFERMCPPRLKSKFYNHYMFGKTSWRGASTLYFECHSRLMKLIGDERDEKHASLLKLFIIMMTISRLNVVGTRQAYGDDSDVIIKLLNDGGVGRKGKFWADVFSKVGISSDAEYI
jgi:hypothetical protein